MGALMRKGGFGYAILVSIGFFVFFVFNTILFRHLAESKHFTPFVSAMMPCIIVSAFGLILTYFALHDGAPPTWAQVRNTFKKPKISPSNPQNPPL
jgi:lipopolysaccharide export system permease protein